MGEGQTNPRKAVLLRRKLRVGHLKFGKKCDVEASPAGQDIRQLHSSEFSMIQSLCRLRPTHQFPSSRGGRRQNHSPKWKNKTKKQIQRVQ